MAPARNLRARAAEAPPDLDLARRLLDQAERHIASAAIPGIDADSRFGMLYDAARKSADAVMRVRRVEAARSIHNAMEYGAREVTDTEVIELNDAATKLHAAARSFVNAAA